MHYLRRVFWVTTFCICCLVLSLPVYAEVIENIPQALISNDENIEAVDTETRSPGTVNTIPLDVTESSVEFIAGFGLNILLLVPLPNLETGVRFGFVELKLNIGYVVVILDSRVSLAVRFHKIRLFTGWGIVAPLIVGGGQYVHSIGGDWFIDREPGMTPLYIRLELVQYQNGPTPAFSQLDNDFLPFIGFGVYFF